MGKMAPTPQLRRTQNVIEREAKAYAQEMRPEDHCDDPRSLMMGFETGATRSNNEGKIDYRGFISPRALRFFGEYMLKHQVQEDGKRRSSDNWKLGMPVPRYVESKVRHDIEFWIAYESFMRDPRYETYLELKEALNGCFFNVQGIMHEWGFFDEMMEKRESANPTWP